MSIQQANKDALLIVGVQVLDSPMVVLCNVGTLSTNRAPATSVRYIWIKTGMVYNSDRGVIDCGNVSIMSPVVAYLVIISLVAVRMYFIFIQKSTKINTSFNSLLLSDLMVPLNLVNICRDNGLMTDGTNPLPALTLTYNQWWFSVYGAH